MAAKPPWLVKAVKETTDIVLGGLPFGADRLERQVASDFERPHTETNRPQLRQRLGHLSAEDPADRGPVLMVVS